MTWAVDWIGPVGDVWAAEWQRTDRSLAALGMSLNAAAAEAVNGIAHPRILDIGCGAGATSLALATALPDAQVVGIDLSPGLIAVATGRAAALTNLTFATGPVEDFLAGRAPVDLFVSRHGVMFFPDPVAAFSAIRAGAAPAGRLLFSCFRPMALNPWAIEILAEILDSPPTAPAGYEPGPFAFADPAFVGDVLERSGWRNAQATAVDFPYRAGGGADPIADALGFFSRIGPAARALRAAPAERRDAMVERIAAVLERHRSGDTVDFPAAAWLWSAQNAAGEAS
jgi:SAM-dependent methyltransferase